MRLVTAPHLFTPDPLHSPGGVLCDDTGRVLALGDAAAMRRTAPAGVREVPLEFALAPAFVNAHTHLHLLHMPRLEGGRGLAHWLAQVLARPQQAESPPAVVKAKLSELYLGGTELVVDLRPPGSRQIPSRQAGLPQVISLCEVNYFTPQLDDRCTPAAHAPYSTPVELARKCFDQARQAGLTTSVHLAESPEERQVMAQDQGPLRDLLDLAGGRDFRPGETTSSTLSWLEAVRSKGPQEPPFLGVHLLDFRPDELCRALELGMHPVLCPRSSGHISGLDTPAEKLVQLGAPFALGTDSPASSPDLFVQREALHLKGVGPQQILQALTIWGARALGRAGKGFGSITVDARPGLLELVGGRGNQPGEALAGWLAADVAVRRIC